MCIARNRKLSELETHVVLGWRGVLPEYGVGGGDGVHVILDEGEVLKEIAKVRVCGRWIGRRGERTRDIGVREVRSLVCA